MDNVKEGELALLWVMLAAQEKTFYETASSYGMGWFFQFCVKAEKNKQFKTEPSKYGLDKNNSPW